MAKAAVSNMNYYEKMVRAMDLSMKAHPQSALVMDMSNFRIIARGRDFKSLSKKVQSSKDGIRSIIFQKPSEKVTWIL